MDGTSPQTTPVTEGALLAEESTINPLSPFPSFLELAFVESMASSGRAALSSSLDAVVSSLCAKVSASSSAVADVSFSERYKIKLYHFLIDIFKRHGPEFRALVMYMIERSFLHSAVCATASESVYGVKRSKIVTSNNNNNNYRRGGIGVEDEKMAQQQQQQFMQIGPMTKADGTRSALLAALAPYAKERLDLLYKREKDRLASANPSPDNNNNNNNNSINTHQTTTTCNENETHCSSEAIIPNRTTAIKKLRQLFLVTYPFLHMTTEGTIMAYRIAYLIGKSIYYGPSLHLLGLVLRRVTLADLSSQSSSTTITTTSMGGDKSKTPKITPTKSKNKMEKSIKMMRTFVVSVAATALVIGWIAGFREEIRRRRRRWIAGRGYNNNHNITTTTTRSSSSDAGRSNAIDEDRNQNANVSTVQLQQQQPSIPPPQPPKLLSSLPNPLPRNTSSCPLCTKPRVNPVASTSGYVFCHRCLVMYIREHGETCPLTGLKCTEKRIIRIYEPTANDNEQKSNLDGHEEEEEKKKKKKGSVQDENLT